jgi:tetratricopeptide (TPR) repeat protein
MKSLLILACSLAALQAQAPKQEQQQPEYYDEPAFIVSGVTDYTYRGGHGSDAVLRSTEALTAATASLKSQSNSSETPAAQQHALADADEKRGNALAAVREYQRAAELDPSESNLFDWGLELLTHRAAEPAIEVFTKGNRLFPRSVRMILGLAAALYMHGDYDRAAQRAFEACDLHPHDSMPYIFLARMQPNSITGSRDYLDRLQRFATIQPDNAWANYYYAAALWKQRSALADSTLARRVEQLLDKSIRLDPKLGEAYLLLGIMHSEQNDLPAAISAFRSAVGAKPELEEAHYRLSQAYESSGDKEKARKEMELYQQLSNASAQRKEHERKELQQFVVTLRK